MRFMTYIINMKDAKDRKEHMKHALEEAQLEYEFIDAVVGKELTLPHKDYNERRYRLAHGKYTSMGELGCYFSHIKALKVFLKSSKEYALILEDDIEFPKQIADILTKALSHSHRFDLLKLCDFHKGIRYNIVSIDEKYSLACSLTRQTGSGGYLVNKKAAVQMLDKLLPMWLPFDHAFDKEWIFGVKTLCINPTPIRQPDIFETQIDVCKSKKLPYIKRYSTVFPYRAYNETIRLFYRVYVILKQTIQTAIYRNR